MKKTSELIADLVKKFRKDPLPLLEGLDFYTYDTIKRIYFYQNDTFVSCDDPNAIFWQVVTPYIPHFSKLIEADPKDFRVMGQGKTNFFQAWILNKKFRKWSDDENFSITIDDMTKAVTSFGSIIWKLVPDDEADEGYCIEAVDLRNVAFDPSCNTIRKTDGFVEFHYLTDSEIRAKKDVWNNTKELIKKAKKVNGKNEIWEFWGEVEKAEDVFEMVHRIGASEGDGEIIAFEEKYEEDEFPYYDIHLDDFKGRWLRVGAYERCFPEQERANTLVNQNAAATEIASLLLLRSADPNTTGNVLQSAINGQIINSADLQQIGIDNRAFSVLLGELDRILQQVQKKLMLPDIAVGDSMPSGTPFRGMAVMSNAYKSAFKQIRTRVITPVADILMEKLLPNLVKTWNKGDLVEMSEGEDDVTMYDKVKSDLLKLDFLLQKEAIRNTKQADGFQLGDEDFASEEELMKIESDVEQYGSQNGRKIELEKGFFNFEYGLVIDPTGETYDKAQQNDAIIQALTLKMSNPAVADEPEYQQLLENNGIPPHKMTMQAKQNIMQNAVGQQPPVMPEMPQGTLAGAVDTNV